jgi:DNA-binding NarL/FixJ family response regulator
VNAPIKVLIVGDEALCQRMRGALENKAGVIPVGQARGAEEALDLMRETLPGVVLLDIAGNLETVGQMRAFFPHIELIVLNDDGQEELVLEALREGALGHLVKDKASPGEIVQAIRAVSRGEAVFSPNIAGWMLDEVTRKHKMEQDD